MGKKTVIIGGVAGGATAAARLRRRDESAEIVLIEKGAYISYANCGLPYYIGDVIKNREALLIQTPKAMKDKFNIEVKVRSEVTAIHVEEKKVTVQNLETGKFHEETYDNLILAMGSSPLKPPIPGINGKNIFTIWNVSDTDCIKTYVTEQKPKRAAIIGGGFIGLEMAENLHAIGVTVSVIEMQKQVMAPIDYDMAQLVHENMRQNDITLILEDGVTSFAENNDKIDIFLASGQTLETDMVILSIGVRPNSGLAKEAGIAVNERGGIVVNDYLETSVKDIYAVGDVIEVSHFTSGEKTMIPLAGPANKQGRICADNIVGDKKTYRGSLGTSIAKVFDLQAAAVGLNEKQMKAAGKEKNKDYYSVIINQKSHAGYYPGATPLTLKMIFEPTGKILGAQAVGQEGVDKRIDTIATTMHLRGTVFDLEELELAYAPPFSSAKDPVNMLGFVAENRIKGLASFMEADELDEVLQSAQKDYTVLDITEEIERTVFEIPGSYHIPLGQLRSRVEELDREKLQIVYCAVGVRSYTAARILQQNGFEKVKILAGGTAFYQSLHHKEVRTETEVKMEAEVRMEAEVKKLDCCGIQCPGPIVKVHEAITSMMENEVLQVSATDMGFARDIEAWCRRTGNTLVKTERMGKENIVTIQKGLSQGGGQLAAAGAESNCCTKSELPQGKTLIVFSGDLDKVLASFIIANGAAAMGRPVTMFFTFWGLNALRKFEKVSVKKSLIEKMFGAMMPRGTGKLKLSKMNMGGMGTQMMKKVMKDKNVDSLEALMKQGMANGIKLVACTMSMDVMGITAEELIDGVELAGVATYLGDAEESNVNLFI